MLVTQNEFEKILEILDKQFLTFVAESYGKEFLSQADKQVLKKAGIDYEKAYDQAKDPLFLNFQLGLLSNVIGETNTKQIRGDKFVKLIQSGEYIPLNQGEKATLNAIKNTSLTTIKSNQGKIFTDINNIVAQKDAEVRASQEEFVRKEVYEGIKARKSRSDIAREIANKTGDYSRDFGKMVEYVSHNALQLGRTALLKRKGGNEQKVIVNVYAGACPNCKRLYEPGGKPKIFTIQELEANGTNIGRKVSDWLPVVPPMHPFSITDKTTSIFTDNGWKMIKDIEIGDMVLTHKGRFKKVLSTLKDFPIPKTKDNTYVYQLFINNGNKDDADGITKLSFTGDHKVLTDSGWKMVKNLSTKDKMYQLYKKCMICDNLLLVNTSKAGKRSCCSDKCSSKYRSQNTHSQWKNGHKELVSKKISNKVKKNWEDGIHINTLKNLKSKEHREKNRDRMLSGGALKAMKESSGKRVSKPQLKLYSMVLELYEDAKLEYHIFNKSLDIALVDYKIDIEFDGQYWHNGKEEYDNKRDELLKNNGWNVLRYSKIPKLGELRYDIDNIISNHDGKYVFKECDISFIKRNFSNKNTKLYDIEVEEDESFIARGLVVHNCRCHIMEYRDPDRKKLDRPKVKIRIGDRNFEV